MASPFFKYFAVYIIGLIICPFMSMFLNIHYMERITFIEASTLTLTIFFPLSVKHAGYTENETAATLKFGQFIALACVAISIFFHYNYDLIPIVYGFIAAFVLTWILAALIWYDHTTDKLLYRESNGNEAGFCDVNKPKVTVRYLCNRSYIEPEAEIITEHDFSGQLPATRRARHIYGDALSRMNNEFNETNI